MIKLIQLHTFSRSRAGYDPIEGARFGWPSQYAQALASSADFGDFEIESWSIDEKMKQEVRFAFNNVSYRIFPSKVYLTPGREHSPELIQALGQVNTNQTILHLHSFFSWPAIKILNRFQDLFPMIAHYHGAPLNPLQAPTVKRVAGLPVAVVEHLLYRRASHQVDAWFTTNDQDLQRLFGIQSATFCPMAPDPVAFKVVDRDAARRRLGLSSGRYLLFAGGFTQIKNLALVLDVLPLILKTVPLTLLIVGPTLEPGYEQTMRKKIQQLGLNSSVQIIGRIDRARLNDYYNVADLLLISSFPGEGMPTTLLEALAVGLSTVATPVGIVPFAAERMPDQVKMASDDPVVYAEAIHSLLALAPPRTPSPLWTWGDVRRVVLPAYRHLLASE